MTAITYAKKHGFRTAKRLPSWDGYDCYEAVLSGDGLNDTQYTGLPQIILCNGETLRMATEEETLRYMDERQPNY